MSPHILTILGIAISLSVRGYPMPQLEENNANETRYPNGTIIGKYTYTDNEGNPIHVKYFADDASYGVELKSLKLFNSNSDLLQPENLSKYPIKISEHPFESSLDPFPGFNDIFNLTQEPVQLFNNNKVKGSHKSGVKNNPEFEIFLQNELKVPEKCGKEKVKVYFDKDKRRTRHAP